MHQPIQGTGQLQSGTPEKIQMCVGFSLPPPGLRFSEHLLTHGNAVAARLLLIHRNFLEW